MIRTFYLTALATLAIAAGGTCLPTLAYATDQADQRQESRDTCLLYTSDAADE